MKHAWSLFLLGILAPAAHAGPVLYQPDIVGAGRIFMVVLDVPVEAPDVAVRVPETVEMLGRTPLPAKGRQRKFYFRALKPAPRAEILFEHPAGAQQVTLEIWGYEDLRRFRTLKGVQLPRRWPLGQVLDELKAGQVVTPAAPRRSSGGAPPGRQWLDVADEQIWSMQPDSTIPRWHWVNVLEGCPVHGRDIYKVRAFYPWKWSYALPYDWKITCPIGGESYPSNDFARGDMTSGAFPDDGIGGAFEKGGVKYGFLAEVNQAYCRHMLTVAPQCADAYVATGDPRYAHKALVAMCRVAEEYAYLATMTHHRHRNSQSQVERLGPAPFSEGPCLAHSGLTTYMIHHEGAAHAEAYDKILPAIEKDAEIIPFLRARGYEVNTHEDVRRFLEENLFGVVLQALMDGATHANPPVAQRAVARIAEVLNYRRGHALMDWLYDGSGGMRAFLVNQYFKDGAPFESTGGYNGIHVEELGPIVESIEHLRQLRPEVYPAAKYPDLTNSRRYHSVFDFAMDTVNIDRTYPKVGDQGGWPRFLAGPRLTWQNGGPASFEHAYRVFRDPKFAWALANAPAWKPSPEFPHTREQVETAAKAWPGDWNDRSALKDGYGLAMLRGGRGERKRALWLNYGRTRWHAQDEVMQIGLDAHGSEILGHMGYPRNWGNWEANWITHLVARQFPPREMTASATLFADAGPVQVAEARAEKLTTLDGPTRYQVHPEEWQRRLVALVDVSDDEFYCLDLYRIHGGNEHWWSFHAQEGEVTTTGLNLSDAEPGTLAGRDVPYGDQAWLEKHSAGKSNYGYRGPLFGFAHLYNVRRTPDILPPGSISEPSGTGAWSVDWALKNANGLHFRLTGLAGAPGEAAAPDTQPAARNPQHAPRTTPPEVILADGTAPSGGKPYEMKWVLVHNAGAEPVRTEVGTLMEMYHGEPLIRSVRRLPLAHAAGQGDASGDEAGFAPFAVAVALRGGRTDYLFVSSNPNTEWTAPGGFAFAGRFGLISVVDGVPVQFVLVGGTRLIHAGRGIRQESGVYRGKIVRVDREREAITIAPAPAAPQAMVGRTVHLYNSDRRVAYRVLKARKAGDAVELELENDSRIGTGRVTGTDGLTVRSEADFTLAGFRYYHGARIANAGRSAEYRLAGIVNGRGALVDPAANPGLTPARLAGQFPQGTWFDVYDYGVGDAVEWWMTSVVAR